jgi:pimeloyl-ACP methyl ester carboxylesterase
VAGEPAHASGRAGAGGRARLTGVRPIDAREQVVPVWRGQVRLRVLSKGSGPDVVFFHGPWGLRWDPFLDALARSFTVHAPEHPGTSPGQQDDIGHLDGLWDLVLCYQEMLDGLGLQRAALVGHSFGGMVACELAAAYPDRVSRLALVDALGLWRADAPITNWALFGLDQIPGMVFRDGKGEAAGRLFGSSPEGEARVMERVQVMWAMGATGKFIWPIPDKGLLKRIHRVKAPALIVWGTDDRLVPPVYADEFERRLHAARVELVGGAGHAPQLEQPDAVAGLVRDFLSR